MITDNVLFMEFAGKCDVILMRQQMCHERAMVSIEYCVPVCFIWDGLD